MLDKDTLHRFIIERTSVRGELVHLDATWRLLRSRSDYPDPVRQVLGEALAAVALLSATIKFKGSLIVQANGDGPMNLLVVQATGGRTVRGLARWKGDVPLGPINRIMGNGRLVITIDPGEDMERYQGIVDLNGDSLGEVLEHYFARSEQLPTRLWLAADGRCAAGLLLQNLPGRSEDADAWNRSVHLADTITPEELLELGATQVLRRLFHEEDVRLFEGERISFRCGCSRERVGEVLFAIGYADSRQTLAEEGVVWVDCEFCNASYEFDAVDIEQLFAARQQPRVTATRH